MSIPSYYTGCIVNRKSHKLQSLKIAYHPQRKSPKPPQRLSSYELLNLKKCMLGPSWWFQHKYILSIGSSPPNEGEHKRCLKPPTRTPLNGEPHLFIGQVSQCPDSSSAKFRGHRRRTEPKNTWSDVGGEKFVWRWLVGCLVGWWRSRLEPFCCVFSLYASGQPLLCQSLPSNLNE